jgi:hypothetical protein
MSVRLDEELYERLQESAARQGRSLNNYVVWMLRLSEMADASHPIDTDNDPPPKPVTRRVKRRATVVGPVDPVAIGEDIVARTREEFTITDTGGEYIIISRHRVVHIAHPLLEALIAFHREGHPESTVVLAEE